MRGQINAIFRIDGGDGDQDFFGLSMLARRVSEPWFGGILLGEEAYLLLLISGRHAGEYIAVTSRQVASLSDQLANGPLASVVVHRLLQPGGNFAPTQESTPANGMAAIEAL
ncbi:hypothetical protein G4G27_15280 [Sphingomonas sp. So64.6b]|uniref:hypothetical protein n=1 Tax=Sphingomonas sp. So64.6b TaxID=2997354 RepID=UPI001602363A|nr:hypothetical protein [Sphingomonas sp. So64.6b]QNA85208.1 hypothetical protein G4G27_15280 [Sphingomonas sp. So64.6b]